ncbi:hypothetical protein [Siphonobacter sp. SORGH_AS_0500]|uniref:hypothetical protein n=1 Tax=Siphonobacter sp. SORGH_AS_0500 TaxID=1864824 RepID=UPI0012FED8BE|nr:hypothetical protein [Siphonobacter sp. SORGH_AS_0500]
MKHAGMLIFWLLCAAAYGQNTDTTQVEWREGYLDIHHINTGRGNSTFFLFPDGTTLLWDAGDLNASAFLKKNAPLKVSPARPNHSKTPGNGLLITSSNPENPNLLLRWIIWSFLIFTVTTMAN